MGQKRYAVETCHMNGKEGFVVVDNRPKCPELRQMVVFSSLADAQAGLQVLERSLDTRQLGRAPIAHSNTWDDEPTEIMDPEQISGVIAAYSPI